MLIIAIYKMCLNSAALRIGVTWELAGFPLESNNSTHACIMA